MPKMNHPFRKILPLIIALAACFSASAFEPLLNIPYEESTTIGLYIKDLRTGEVLVDHKSRRAMTPASVTKLFTSAAILMQRGTSFQFQTDVCLSGCADPADPARWQGDIIINSVADPSIDHPEFASFGGFCDSIIAKLQARGITSISGSIRINESLEDAGPIANWECEDIPWAYGAGLYGFNYARNVVEVFPNKGITVPASSLKIRVVQSRGTTDLRRGFNSDNLTVVIPRRKRQQRELSFTTTVNNPADMFTRLLTERLLAAEITLENGSATCEPITLLYPHTSTYLGEIVYVTNKNSDNLLAEGLLRALEPDSCRQACIDTEIQLLDSLHVPTESLDILDGSGLSRATLMSPYTAAVLLENMLQTNYADLFVDMLPVAGVDGTLKSFAVDTPLQNRLVMKTGSMRSVQNMAGYILDDEGWPSHVVVVFVNGFRCKRADLRTAIADYLTQFIDNE